MRNSLGLLALILLTALVGCDRDTSTPASGTSTDPASRKAAPPPEIRIGYFANVAHAQALLGITSGEFASAVAPSKLSTKTFNAGPSLIEAMFAGAVDIGYVGPSPAINAHAKSKGRGIRVIAGASANGVLVMARADSGIATLADLAGRKVATPQLGNTQDVSARHYLKTSLKQASLDNVVPVANAEQAGMMQRGQIDAAWVPEPWGSLLVKQTGARVIGYEHDLWPEKEFILALVVTTPEFLAAHPDAVERVLRIHRAWTARLVAHPDQQVAPLGDSLASITGKRIPDDVLAASLSNVRFTDDPIERSLETFDRWAYELEFTRSPTDLSGLVDATILRKLERSAP